MRSLLLLGLVACAPKVVPAAAAEPVAVDPAPLTGEILTEGSIGKRLSNTPADLVIFYGGEQKGSTETCGCPHRPRGSLARLDAYVDASRERSPAAPSVLVNAGYWLQDAMGFDGKLRDDVVLGNRWMVTALRMGGWDALNVSYNDVAALATLPKDDGPALPLVSANVEGPGIQKWAIVERGGLRVGITGITAKGETLTDVKDYTVNPPGRAAAVLDELAPQVDVVVLLAYQATDVARTLATAHQAVDVVIDADRHSEFMDPFYVKNAAWVFSHYQTMRAGELRLRLAGGRVVGGVDRHIDLDPEMPDDKALREVSEAARTDLNAAQQALYGGQ